MYRSVLESQDFARWTRDAVVLLVAHNERGHEEREERDAYGNTVRRCTLYPGIACNDHLDAAVDIDTARADGLVKVPFLELCPNTWLVSPTGEVDRVAEADQFVPSAIRAQVEALQKRLGPAVPASGWAALRDLAAKADAALEQSRYRDALGRLADLGKAVKKPHASLLAFLRERLDSIQKYVGSDFEEARDDARLSKEERRARIARLLESVDVEVLGARLDCHATIKAWLDAK